MPTVSVINTISWCYFCLRRYSATLYLIATFRILLPFASCQFNIFKVDSKINTLITLWLHFQ